MFGKEGSPSDIPDIRELLDHYFAEFYRVENFSLKIPVPKFREKVESADICRMASLAPGQPFFEQFNDVFRKCLLSQLGKTARKPISVEHLARAIEAFYNIMCVTQGAGEFTRLIRRPDTLSNFLEHFGFRVYTSAGGGDTLDRGEDVPELGSGGTGFNFCPMDFTVGEDVVSWIHRDQHSRRRNRWKK